MPERPPHHEDAFGAAVCSEDRHARVEGPSEGRVCRAHDDLSCMRRVHTLRAHARRRSPPRRPPDIRCRRRACRRGRIPATVRRTDQGLRSDGAPRRAPPFRRPGCLLPPRHARESSRRDCSLRPSRRLSRSRRPHVSHRVGTCCGWALQGHGAVTRGSVNIESTNAFSTWWTFRAWD